MAYIGAGDPNLAATENLAVALDAAGVDVLELGVPFSDPLADGLVNQLSAQRGLASGTTPTKLFESITAIRQRSEIPIVLYIYYNLIHRRGLAEFIAAAATAGVDGILALDLPPEEADEYETLMRGIYRAVDLYNNDPDKFLAVAAPVYDVTPDVMAGDLGGVYYTTYEDALEYFGVGGQTAKLGGVIDSLNDINVDLDLMDAAIGFDAMVDPSLTDGLFDGHKR